MRPTRFPRIRWIESDNSTSTPGTTPAGLSALVADTVVSVSDGGAPLHAARITPANMAVAARNSRREFRTLSGRMDTNRKMDTDGEVSELAGLRVPALEALSVHGIAVPRRGERGRVRRIISSHHVGGEQLRRRVRRHDALAGKRARNESPIDRQRADNGPILGRFRIIAA